MKSKIKNFALICLAGIFAACLWTACNEKESNEEPQPPQEEYEWEGYIMGYHSSSGIEIDGDYGKAGGYILISSDLKDSLLTFNLSDTLLHFPADCFPQIGRCLLAFPSQYRHSFKIKMNFRLATPEEEPWIPVHGCSSYPFIHLVQVVIQSIAIYD